MGLGIALLVRADESPRGGSIGAELQRLHA